MSNRTRNPAISALSEPEVFAGAPSARQIAWLAGLSFVCTLPYGLALSTDIWRPVILFVGSTAVCVPSLYIFSNYLGFELSIARTGGLSLLMTAVAALFCTALAPILWFFELTMGTAGTVVPVSTISMLFLTSALVAGMVQVFRALAAPAEESAAASESSISQNEGRLPDYRHAKYGRSRTKQQRSSGLPFLLLCWQGLVVLVFARMGTVLALW